MRRSPIVIAHRGACGYVPEHTLAAYFFAMQQGADFIEPDLVMTRDGVLVARHENEISQTTDVARRAQFAQRRCRKVIDGLSVDGWFTEDFTLAELKQLKAIERLPALRPCNMRLDGMFRIPTLDEILRLVAATQSMHGATVGVYPETKHPSYFAALDLPMERVLVGELERYGYCGHDAAVFIQSFETANLRALRELTAVPLVQLAEDYGQPFDFVLSGDRRTYTELMSRNGLLEIAQYADAVGVNKNLVLGAHAHGQLRAPSAVVTDAHAAGLEVHVWTLRAENHFLRSALRIGKNDATHGDLPAEIEAFLAAGVDGFFTDHPDVGVRARDRFLGVSDE
jgi:glycerophosphoryl diester phosphodiesterase